MRVQSPALAPHPPILAHPVPLISEWQEYHKTRDQILHDNTQLAAEYRTLLDDIHKQDQALDAAMVQADPSVAPLLAKVALTRHRSVPPIPTITK